MASIYVIWKKDHPIIEKIENKVRFHFYQTFKVLKQMNDYDLIFVHGSNSAMLLCALNSILSSKASKFAPFVHSPVNKK